VRSHLCLHGAIGLSIKDAKSCSALCVMSKLKDTTQKYKPHPSFMEKHKGGVSYKSLTLCLKYYVSLA